MTIKQSFIFASVVLLTVITSTAETPYMRYVGDADKAIAAQKWDEAEEALMSALREEPSNPGNVMLMSNLGMIQFYSGRDSAALATLTDAHRIAPSSTVILANRARVLTVVGATDLAIRDYDLIEQLDSTAWQPYLYRGLIYLASGDCEKAEHDLTRLESLRPNHTDTHVALAALYSALGNNEDAIAHFNKLIAADPQPEYYAGRAMCFIQKEWYQDASDDIASGLELDDKYAELYVCRALLNRRRFLRDESLADAQRAINLGADKLRVKSLLDL